MRSRLLHPHMTPARSMWLSVKAGRTSKRRVALPTKTRSLRLKIRRISHEAFYPLSVLGDRTNRFSFLYLFGVAQKRLSKAMPTDPFILNPVTLMTNSACPTSPPTRSITPCVILKDFISNGVTATTPSNRDIYKIGAGMDLIRLFKGKG